METTAPTWTLGALAAQFQGEAVGPPDLPLARPVAAGDDDALGITFAENAKYLALVEASGVGAVIVPPDLSPRKPHIKVAAPRVAFFMLLHASQRPMKHEPGVHQTAVVDSTAVVDPTASVGPFVWVGPNAKVAANVVLHAGVSVGDRSEIGEGSVLFPRVTLYPDVRLGQRCIVHAGAVIGADGFGFVWDGQRRMKVPQVGGVRIGNDVEIGANTCIDRATAGDTILGDGVKIDNLVQIGHNGKIGDHVVIAGQSGVSGSVSIGPRSVLGGGVGTKDHVTIGADVMLGGRSGVDGDILEPGEYFGTPARPAREALRAFVLLPKLPELWSRLRKLERQVGASDD